MSRSGVGNGLLLRGAAAAILLYVLILSATPAHADAPVLNDDEQAEVNLAIDRGVKFLKTMQNQDGSWSGPKGEHPVGYTAISGLALIECGVPIKDPSIQRAVYYIGSHVDKLDHTYQLSLAILFLDAFAQDDSKFSKQCQELIRTLAMRLVAGQTQSGGWHYSCPVLDVAVQRTMFKILSERNELYPLAAGPAKPDPKEKPDTKKTTKKKQPTPVPPALYQYAVLTSPRQLAWMDTKDRATCNSNTQFAILGLWTARKHGVPVGPSFNLVVNRFRRSQSDDGGWAYAFINGGGNASTPAMTCCGLMGLAVGYALGIDVADANKPAGMKDPVGGLKDPGGILGAKKPVAADDAGNEGWRHFAGRGCRRYADVVDPDPVNKPENAADGTSMIKGFGFVANRVGKPVGRMKDLPMQSLYFLWSLERVSVLYNLGMLGDRDWYRWGAEILVANQAGSGAWERDGGYPGQTPVLNTCFALLFLKRANLAMDLTKKLPFEGSMLAAEIRNAAPPPPEPTKEPVAVVPSPVPPPAPTPPTPTPVKMTPPPAETPSVERVKQDDGSGKLWLGFGIAAIALFLLAGAGILAFLMMGDKDSKKKKKKNRVRDDDDYADQDGDDKARKKSQPKMQSNGNGDSVKKSRPKMQANDESSPARKKTRPKMQVEDDE
jgi:hypothetical protein